MGTRVILKGLPSVGIDLKKSPNSTSSLLEYEIEIVGGARSCNASHCTRRNSASFNHSEFLSEFAIAR